MLIPQHRFRIYSQSSTLSTAILLHLNEHRVKGLIPRHDSINTYISTIAVKGARAAKFGENEQIQSVQADLADELAERAETGFRCKFNILQIMAVSSSVGGSKRDSSLN